MSRANSDAPTSSSSRRMLWLIAGCVRFIRSAARVKVPSSTTARKCSRWSRSMRGRIQENSELGTQNFGALSSEFSSEFKVLSSKLLCWCMHRYRPHPWHGLEVGPEPPAVVNAFIEITPFDLMKYEVDKSSGYLKVDRPQRSSAQHPALYGFVPRTYCSTRVRKLARGAKRGDGDPLDICVLSERAIARNEIIVRCRV